MNYILWLIQLVILAEVSVLLVVAINNRRKHRSRGMLFIDTSVLIDGRIVEIAKSRFIGREIAVPRSVINELQLLADGSDSNKRARARFGLDIISNLQSLEGIETVIYPDNPSAPEGVDRRLISLAMKYDGVLCTVDYNLNKVAQVEGVRVANVNELAKNLRMQHLPGDVIKLNLTTKGNDVGQAVGHLDDGTMVVVENAKAKIGEVVKVEIIRSLQTDAGRMLFAKVTQDTHTNEKPTRGNIKKANFTSKSNGRNKNLQVGKNDNKSSTKEARPARNSKRTAADNESRLVELANK